MNKMNMKHIKLYENYSTEENSNLTKRQVNFLNKCTTGTWKENLDGTIDIKGSFDFANSKGKMVWFGKIKGIKFGQVTEHFNCYERDLISLDCAPEYVGGWFNCSSNMLTTLDGSPKKYMGDLFDCSNNKLATLKGAPLEVPGDFLCYENNLINLEGAPDKVGGDFSCFGNSLISLKGAPNEIGGMFQCDAFLIRPDKEFGWNIETWLRILNGNIDTDYYETGYHIEISDKKRASDLILSLLDPDYFNKELKLNPGRVIIMLKDMWNNEDFADIRKDIIIPKEYEKVMDLVSGLSSIGF